MGVPNRKRTDEEKARIDRATKRVVIRLIDGQFDVEFDVADGEYPLSPRELLFVKQALHVRYNQYKRKYSLSQRMETRLRNEEELRNNPPSVEGQLESNLVAGIQITDDEILLVQEK